ncbi:molybdenum cofactor guanylyltransferase [Synechococcus sp. MU1655]|uniref:molybdenum cofactor guanylyltransferase n=1 Tax=Synechococcus sp. MU1655 TaxID=2508355 RepID=UPI00202606C6|nr:molybdenum cofactor guanylyltransferase [Synechococcus sp. MU1655]
MADFSLVQDLEACVLSGGLSRRMGRDKALIPHPQGGCWLTRSIELSRKQGLAVHVVSSHSSHDLLASALDGVTCRSDPFPGMGPLAALSAVFGKTKALGLLVMPVDMPWLESTTLDQLIGVWKENPSVAVVSHDGNRLQPLFAIYPNDSVYRTTMLLQLASDQLRMLDWLHQVPYQTLVLPEALLRNANCPADLTVLDE